MPIAIQLAHAGRKASTRTPWKGSGQIRPGEDRGWQTVAPSAVPFAAGENPSVALDHDGLAAATFIARSTRGIRISRQTGGDGGWAASADIVLELSRSRQDARPHATASADRRV